MELESITFVNLDACGAVVSEQRLLIGLPDGGFAQALDLCFDQLPDEKLLPVRATQIVAILQEQCPQPCGNEGILAGMRRVGVRQVAANPTPPAALPSNAPGGRPSPGRAAIPP